MKEGAGMVVVVEGYPVMNYLGSQFSPSNGTETHVLRRKCVRGSGIISKKIENGVLGMILLLTGGEYECGEVGVLKLYWIGGMCLVN